MRPIWIGGLIAPLAAPILFFFALLFFSVTKDGLTAGLQSWQAGVAASLIFVLPVSYATMWALGMPYIYWLQRKSRLSMLRICVAAIVLGAFGVWVFQQIGKSGPLDVAQLMHGALIGAGLAFSVALVFCWIVKVPRS